MKASKLFVLSVSLALCAAVAHAQQYKWKDSRGRTVYGDVPPAGVNATPLSGVPSSAPAAPAPAPAKPAGAAESAKTAAAKSGKPLTPAEQEMEFRRRVKEAQEAAAKKAKEDQKEHDIAQNCELAREQERTLLNQPRIARTNEKGERYYMDDDQRAQALAKTRQSVAEWCK
jgi:hypothetical protein